jgi:hypothetical protein
MGLLAGTVLLLVVFVLIQGGVRSGHRNHRIDEFTGDPKVRDIWESSRANRHKVIRIMHGNSWAEASLLERARRLLSHAGLWIVGVPFVWAALLMVIFFATAVVMALLDMNEPVEKYLGHGFDGGIGDWIVFGSLGLSVALNLVIIWGKEANREREIRRLRGLSNTDLLKDYDDWNAERLRRLQAMNRTLEEANRRYERQLDNDDLARKVGQETLKAGRILDFERRTGNVRFPE